MFRTLFEDSDLLGLPVSSMLVFMTVFVAVIAFVTRRSRKPVYERMALLPLADDYEGDGEVDR